MHASQGIQKMAHLLSPRAYDVSNDRPPRVRARAAVEARVGRKNEIAAWAQAGAAHLASLIAHE